MRYSIGYRLPDEYVSVPELCERYDGAVSGVFFSWAGEPGGRLPLCGGDADAESAVAEVQLAELSRVKQLGKSLTLLLNANCYGERAVSKELKEHVLRLADFLKTRLDIDSVTTASPFIADCIRDEFGGAVRLTASVNMKVSTVQAMKQLSSSFDGYYMAKECNRDFKTIEKLHSWCVKNGKTLHILANSGCLTYCGFQTFHDNFVAHQKPGDEVYEGWDGLPSPCHRYLRSIDEDSALALFMQSSWIPPGEVGRYSAYFSEMKLATRMHDRIGMVVAAYARGRYEGNLLDLTEPSFSRDFRGVVLDARKLGSEFFDKVASCGKNCDECGYCLDAARRVKTEVCMRY